LSASSSFGRVDDAELADLATSGATALAMPLSESDVDRLITYVRLIERWTTTYNLTAIRDPRDMVTQHIVDSLAAAAALRRRRGPGAGERLLDVGSGAGLPGIVLAVTSPERAVTCVDSVGKKVAFITHVAGSLGLKNVRAVHARVETMADDFDVIASRAFASLHEFVALTDHLLSDSGTWMAMKGKTPEEELAGVDERVTFHVEPVAVPKLVADRCIVWMNRTREASARS
jgi:16S rRNA (guanine527-N7)-methyltransferase